MAYKSDIEIAQEAVVQDIREIARKIGLTEEDLSLYGNTRQKLTITCFETEKENMRSSFW